MDWNAVGDLGVAAICGVALEMSYANPQDALAYHRAWRARNKERLREKARTRFARTRSSKRWLYWLLDTLEFSPEPEYVVLVPSPVRKPTLRLRRQ